MLYPLSYGVSWQILNIKLLLKLIASNLQLIIYVVLHGCYTWTITNSITVVIVQGTNRFLGLHLFSCVTVEGFRIILNITCYFFPDFSLNSISPLLHYLGPYYSCRKHKCSLYPHRYSTFFASTSWPVPFLLSDLIVFVCPLWNKLEYCIIQHFFENSPD